MNTTVEFGPTACAEAETVRVGKWIKINYKMVVGPGNEAEGTVVHDNLANKKPPVMPAPARPRLPFASTVLPLQPA